jgi:superfamily I DNA and/or RNA helicase
LIDSLVCAFYASSSQGSLGFLTNYKRTNVALSRAKSLLLVVGNMKLLSTDQTWSNAIGLAKNMGAMTGDIGSG